jgi:type II secretory pathway component GspD/PulD (secretin)
MVGTATGTNVIPNTQTGTIVVTAPKEVQAQVRDYLEDQNKMLRKMVNVTMDIYSIKESDSDSQGFNPNVLFTALTRDYSVNITSPANLASTAAGTLTYTKLNGDVAGSTAVLNALRQSGMAIQHKPVSLTTMNGKIKVQSNTNTQGYVRETTPGASSGSGAAGAPGLKTDTVTTGDMYSVLPVIQPDNSILLKYSFRLSTLLNITNFTSGTGTAQQTVQVPQTDSVGDGSDVRLLPGESIMITGLTRTISSGDSNRIGENASILFGGSNKSSLTKEHFVVLLRATPF